MLNYHGLWLVWCAWGAGLAALVFPDVRGLWAVMLTVLCTGGVTVVSEIFINRRKHMLLSGRRGREAEVPATEKPTTPVVHAGALTGEVRTRRSTFLSSDIVLSGRLEGQGDIVIEGSVEGDICCAREVTVESGGRVAGDITAGHLTVNGQAEGTFRAGVIHILAEGMLKGDIWTRELVIEKGGAFTGRSHEPEDMPAEQADRLTQEQKAALFPFQAQPEGQTQGGAEREHTFEVTDGCDPAPDEEKV